MTNNPIIQVFAPNPLTDTFRTLPVQGIATGAGGAAVTVQLAGTTDDGSLITGLIADTGAEPVSPPNALRVQSFGYGFDDVSGNFFRLRVQDDSIDDLASLEALLATANHNLLFNDNGWDRARSLDAANLATFSGIGGAIAAGPGEWSVEHRPAVTTQATITRAAGAAGVRHVCRSITASLVAVAAQTVIDVLLRDGATGAGAVLWSARMQVPAGDSKQITLTGLNIVGSAATAMTLEFSGAPVATNFEGVAMTGYDAS